VSYERLPAIALTTASPANDAEQADLAAPMAQRSL